MQVFHCGDKGVSVGERALVNFDELQGLIQKLDCYKRLIYRNCKRS